VSKMKITIFMIATSTLSSVAHATAWSDIDQAFKSGQYFSAARMAFNEANHSTGSNKALAYAWVTESLIKAGLDQSAFYFFGRTLQLQDRPASKRVLEFAGLFTERMGPDVMRSLMTKYTRVDDYSAKAKNAFYLVNAKERLVKGEYSEVIKAVDSMSKNHPLYPVGLQLRGTANVILKRLGAAVQDFRLCAEKADLRFEDADLKAERVSVVGLKWYEMKRQSAKDLYARCRAGEARTLYEMERFEDADIAYDDIPKGSLVWPDTLFEHAWNSYAKLEYNRTLGKLVSYKSPALSFVFNTEVEVLMAQTYAALCLYQDANQVIDGFNRQYGPVAKEIKTFVDGHSNDIPAFYRLGRQALADKLHTDRMMNRFLNRFVRAPYFQSLALSEERSLAEKVAIQRLDGARPDTSTGVGQGFPGFLNQVLSWRIKTIQSLGGIYVKNSVLDYHSVLISDFEKIQFMKIDILSMMKKKLMEPEEVASEERSRGNRRPVRRHDQMLWTFNGEFWNDEIGDYVFALESECERPVQQ
jgi:hypothetical protein